MPAPSAKQRLRALEADVRTPASELREAMAAAAEEELELLRAEVRAAEEEHAQRRRERIGAEEVYHAAAATAQGHLATQVAGATRRLVSALAESDHGVPTALAVTLFKRALAKDELVHAKKFEHIPPEDELEEIEANYRHGLEVLDLAVVCGFANPLQAEPAIRQQLDEKGEIRVADVRARQAKLRQVLLERRKEQEQKEAEAAERPASKEWDDVRAAEREFFA